MFNMINNDVFCNSNFRCRQKIYRLESLMRPKNVLSHCEMVTYLLGNVRRPESCIMPSLKKHLRKHPVYILSLLFNEEKVSERDYVIKNLGSYICCNVLSYTIIESIFGSIWANIYFHQFCLVMASLAFFRHTESHLQVK